MGLTCHEVHDRIRATLTSEEEEKEGMSMLDGKVKVVARSTAVALLLGLAVSGPVAAQTAAPTGTAAAGAAGQATTPPTAGAPTEAVATEAANATEDVTEAAGVTETAGTEVTTQTAATEEPTTVATAPAATVDDDDEGFDDWGLLGLLGLGGLAGLRKRTAHVIEPVRTERVETVVDPIRTQRADTQRVDVDPNIDTRDPRR